MVNSKDNDLKEGQPSRFHKFQFIHKEDRFDWILNQQHPELKSTATCDIDNTLYCAYCGKRALPIQAYLGDAKTHEEYHQSWRYKTTGHTCDCKKARLERQFQDELQEFDRKVSEKRKAFCSKHLKRLKFDDRKLLKIRHKQERDKLERDMKFHSAYYPNNSVLNFKNDPRNMSR